MKFRCPYCKHVIEGDLTTICPQCRKTIKVQGHLKESVEKLKEEQARERIAAGPRKIIFSSNHLSFTSPVIPIAFMTLLVGGIVISKYNKSPYKYSSIEFNDLSTTMEKAANTSMEMAKKELRILRIALEMFHRDCGRYPSTKEGIIALINNPGELTWKGPYVTFTRPDPWKHPYQYIFTNDVMRIFSGGPDETTRTADDVIPPEPTQQDIADYNLPVPTTNITP